MEKFYKPNEYDIYQIGGIWYVDIGKDIISFQNGTNNIIKKEKDIIFFETNYETLEIAGYFERNRTNNILKIVKNETTFYYEFVEKEI